MVSRFRFALHLFMLLFLCAGNYTSQAQQRWHWKVDEHLLTLSHWSIQDGLPTWRINDLFQDSRDFIWLANDLGLTRFDGSSFKHYDLYKYKFRIRNKFKIAEDVRGNIWAFSTDEEDRLLIDVFDPVLERVYPIEQYLGQNLSFSKLAMEGIFRVGKKIWVLDPAGNGGYFDGKWHPRMNDQQHTGKIVRYLPAPDGNFWAWEGYSVIHLIKSDGTVLKTYPLRTHNSDKLWVDETLALWLIHIPLRAQVLSSAMKRIRKDGVQAFPTGSCPVVKWGNSSKMDYTHVLINQNRTGLFFGYKSISLYQKGKKIPLELNTEIAPKVGNDINYPVFMDKNGAFWFFSTQGLSSLSVEKNTFKTYLSNQIPFVSCRGMTTIGDSVLLVNTYSGAFRININTEKKTPLNYPGNDAGTIIKRDGSSLWIGQHSVHLIKYNLKNNQSKKLPYAIPLDVYTDAYAIHFLPDSTIFIGTESGIYSLKKGYSTLQTVHLRDTTVYCYFKNQQGIWVGTKKGLVLLDHQGKKIIKRFYTNFSNPSLLSVYFIFEDKEGMFWMATSEGLCKWQPFTSKAHWFEFSRQLPEKKIHAIYEDSRGCLWLPSNFGLICFNPKNNVVKTFRVEDGLFSNEFNLLSHYRDPQGRFYFGGTNGVVMFHPDSLLVKKKKSSPLELQLTFVNLFHKKKANPEPLLRNVIASGGHLKIAPRYNRLEIGFSTPEYNGATLTYTWRNEQEGTAWKEISTPFLQFNSLPYGRMRLTIRATLQGNSQDEIKPIRLTILVVRPFYKTIWFFLLLLSAIAILVFYLFRLRIQFLNAQNQFLQQRVEERTAELVQKTSIIERQASEIERKDRVKTKMFIDINHELRTPITLMQWSLKEIFKQKKLADFETERLLSIEKNTKKLEQLANEILLLAQPDKADSKLQETTVVLASFVRRIFSAFQSWVSARQIQYHLDTTIDASVAVLIDGVKLEKILNNLISNALKYSNPGDSIEVKLDIHDEKIEIQVRDTGIGISNKDLKHIFERFYQVQKLEDKNTLGYGVGLSLAQDYAQIMGGILHAESALGKGTTMTLILPFKEQLAPLMTEEIDPRGIVHPPELAGSGISPHAGAQLLLVEDIVEMRDYIHSFLTPHYQVTLAQNGIEALAILKQAQFDLIVSDVMMPGMDGFELLQTVRNDDRSRMVPFLMLTARAESKDQLTALRLGVDGYLTKPFDAEELLARVSNLLTNHEMRKVPFEHISQDTATPSLVPQGYVDKWLRELENIVEKQLQQSNFNVQTLALQMAVSERTLRDRIREYTGLSPQQYILEARLSKARLLLENQVFQSVAEVSYAVGIKTPSYLAKLFKERFGKSPSEYL